MPTQYGGTNTFPATVDIPSGSDKFLRQALNVVFEALLDRTMWLKNRTLGEQNVPMSSVKANDFTWEFLAGPSALAQGWKQGTPGGGTGANTVFVPLRIPEPAGSVKITQLRARFRAATGHGALPAFLPRLSLVAQGAAGNAGVSFGTVIDAPADVAAYESASGRELILALNNTLTTSDSYYIQLTGEGSTNSLAGLLYTLVAATFAQV